MISPLRSGVSSVATPKTRRFSSSTFVIGRKRANGFVADQEVYKEYEQLHDQFKNTKIQIKDLEDAQEADVTETGGSAVDDGEIPF